MTTAYVPNVSGADVAAMVGRGADTAFATGTGALAAAAARDAASSYTRGVGFDVPAFTPASLRVVILNRAIRIAFNAQQLLSEARDGVSMNYGNAAQGWTLEERDALREYRREACSI